MAFWSASLAAMERAVSNVDLPSGPGVAILTILFMALPAVVAEQVPW